MGAWAEDAFGNDTACDWAGDFSDAPSMTKVKDAIEAVIAENDYLDSDIAAEALVACEIVARLKGQWGSRSAYSESVDNWIESCSEIPDAELTIKAAEALNRILGDNSELQELWDEDEVNEDWHREMDDLAKRVTS